MLLIFRAGNFMQNTCATQLQIMMFADDSVQSKMIILCEKNTHTHNKMLSKTYSAANTFTSEYLCAPINNIHNTTVSHTNGRGKYYVKNNIFSTL